MVVFPQSFPEVQKHFSQVGAVRVQNVLDALSEYSVEFLRETGRQNYPGSAHPDSETIYLRMPRVLTYNTMFNSLEVVNLFLCEVPKFQHLLNDVSRQVGGRMARAMIIKLKAGGKIHPHIDQGIYAESTERYHVPLITNDRAWLKVGGVKSHTPVGEIVYFNKHVLHEGANEGSADRIHLVVDFFRGTA